MLVCLVTARLSASRADRFPMVLPSGGSTSSSRSPRSSSPASGVVKVAESVTGTGRFHPFSPLGQGFARYAPTAWTKRVGGGNPMSSRTILHATTHHQCHTPGTAAGCPADPGATHHRDHQPGGGCHRGPNPGTTGQGPVGRTADVPSAVRERPRDLPAQIARPLRRVLQSAAFCGVRTPSVPGRLMVPRWYASRWIFSGSTVLTANTPPMQSALRRFPESSALLLTGSAPRSDAHLTAV